MTCDDDEDEVEEAASGEWGGEAGDHGEDDGDHQ